MTGVQTCALPIFGLSNVVRIRILVGINRKLGGIDAEFTVCLILSPFHHPSLSTSFLVCSSPLSISLSLSLSLSLSHRLFFFFLRNNHTQERGKGVLIQRHTTTCLSISISMCTLILISYFFVIYKRYFKRCVNCQTI